MQNSLDSIISLTENQESYLSQQIQPKKIIFFQIRRIFIFCTISIVDVIVFFQRACPAVVTDELSKAYNIKVSQLGIFTSMFFIPFSILQLFAGLLSDVLEPSFIIGGSMIFGSIGAVICGLSRNLFEGCIGRLIVGMGCGLIYSPCTRIIMNWFPLQHYSKLLGLFLFIAGLGNFLAQTPLTLLANQIGWRMCFISIAIIATFLAVLTIIFVRGNPVHYGYPAVNPSLSSNVSQMTIKERFSKLLKNFKTIFSHSNFWCIAILVFFGNGSFYNVNGIWGGPYLKERLGYDSIKMSNALLGLSLGNNFGALLNPYVPDIFFKKSKKWSAFVEVLISILCCLPFVFCPEKLNFAMVVSLLAVYAITTAGVGVIVYPLCIESFHPSMGGSVSGCCNCFAFLSCIIFMPITGKILEKCGMDPKNPDIHSAEGFKYGLWVFNICALSIGSLFFLFVKNPKKENDKNEQMKNDYEQVE